MKPQTSTSMTTQWKWILIPVFALIMLASCEKEETLVKKEKNNVETTANNNQVPETIINKLKQAGFDTSEGLRKFENGYLVEYDILLTEKQIDEIIANKKPSNPNERTEHYRTSNLVTGTPRVLRVYMDPSFGTYMQNSFDAALARYNAANISLTFQRTTSTSNAHISILSFYEVSNTLGFSAGFPSGGNPASPIRLNTYFYNNSSSRPDATTVIAHEIGHAIGYRHTDYMNRAFSCGTGGNEGAAGVGAVHINGTPTGPSANSWMLACSNNTDRPFTSSDLVALRNVYPIPFWVQLPGAAYDVGVGPDGSAYVIGTGAENGGYGIYRWNGTNWTKISGAAVRIAVGPGGVPWVVNSYGNIYRRNGSGWDLLPGAARDIGVGADGSVYVIGTGAESGGYGIYRWNGSGWTKISGGAVRVAVSPTGVPWVVNSSGNIYRRNGSGWDLMPGAAKDVGISSNGTVFVIGTGATSGGYGIYQWNGSGWTQLPGGATNISAGPGGIPWVVNSVGNIYRKR